MSHLPQNHTLDSNRLVYVNGEFVEETKATISIFDRGFLFADAVYEVTAVLNRKLIDFKHHMERLKRSLSELGINYPYNEKTLLTIHRTLVEKNNIENGLVYLQISRGVADRDFNFTNKPTTPTIVLFTQKKDLVNNPVFTKGIKILSKPDLRWGRCDIKTIQLLYSSLLKTELSQQGYDDAWLVKDGVVTEGSSNNVWLVDNNNRLITPRLSKSLLPGITRASVMRFAQENGFEVLEKPFTIEEAQRAKEAFSTSATTFVYPVVEINNKPIGDGLPGEISKKLLAIYIEESLNRAI